MTFEELHSSGLSGAAFTVEYQKCWDFMTANTHHVTGTEHDELVKACQKNPWICDRGWAFTDDPFFELDSPYEFLWTDDPAALREYFAHGNWAVRNGIRYGDLLFVNQVGGGDEWWTAKKFDGEWIGFESVSFRRIIEKGGFDRYLNRLVKATKTQCEHLTY